MKTEPQHSCWWTTVLIVAGIMALAFGPKAVLITAVAAMVVRYAILEPSAHGNRS